MDTGLLYWGTLMDWDLTEDNGFTRRDLLRLSGLSLAGIATFSLAGCGGGGGFGGAAVEIPLRAVSGSVNVAELGGTSHRVLSVHDETGGAVSAKGTFRASVSAIGAQLLLVADGAGALRGLGMARPGQSITVDAASTAAAMVLMMPGLTSSDLVEAADRLARIQSHASFPTLAARVRALLRTGGLASVAADTEAETLKETIATDVYLTLGGRGTTPSNEAIAFKGEWGKGPAASQELKLEHNGYRYVRLDVVKLDKDGANLKQEVLRDTAGAPITAMTGTNFRSFGSILAGSTFTPTQSSARMDLTDPAGCTRIKVYVSGPGGRRGAENFPLSNSELRECYGKTALMLAVMPILDLVTGGAGAAGAGGKAFEKIAALYGSIGGNLSMQNFIAACLTGDARSIAGALLDVSVAAFGATVGILAILGVASATAGPAATAALVLSLLSLPITARNFYLTAQALLKVPSTQSIELAVSSGNVIIG